MKTNNVKELTRAALIASLYVVLTIAANVMGLSGQTFQIRISEALCVLPYFTGAAVPGLTIGCLLGNLMTGAAVFDILFGSLATCIGAIGTYLLRKHKILMLFPPIIANMVAVPLILRYGYGISWYYGEVDLSIPFYAFTVGVGEFIAVGFFGSLLYRMLLPYRHILFQENR